MCLVVAAAAAAAKSLQSFPTLCDPIDPACPWDSPGKYTGVGCHYLLQCMKVKSESEVAQSWLTLSSSMDCSLPGSSVHDVLLFLYLGFRGRDWKVSSFPEVSKLVTIIAG